MKNNQSGEELVQKMDELLIILSAPDEIENSTKIEPKKFKSKDKDNIRKTYSKIKNSINDFYRTSPISSDEEINKTVQRIKNAKLKKKKNNNQKNLKKIKRNIKHKEQKLSPRIFDENEVHEKIFNKTYYDGKNPFVPCGNGYIIVKSSKKQFTNKKNKDNDMPIHSITSPFERAEKSFSLERVPFVPVGDPLTSNRYLPPFQPIDHPYIPSVKKSKHPFKSSNSSDCNNSDTSNPSRPLFIPSGSPFHSYENLSYDDNGSQNAKRFNFHDNSFKDSQNILSNEKSSPNQIKNKFNHKTNLGHDCKKSKKDKHIPQFTRSQLRKREQLLDQLSNGPDSPIFDSDNENKIIQVGFPENSNQNFKIDKRKNYSMQYMKETQHPTSENEEFLRESEMINSRTFMEDSLSIPLDEIQPSNENLISDFFQQEVYSHSKNQDQQTEYNNSLMETNKEIDYLDQNIYSFQNEENYKGNIKIFRINEKEFDQIKEKSMNNKDIVRKSDNLKQIEDEQSNHKEEVLKSKIKSKNNNKEIEEESKNKKEISLNNTNNLIEKEEDIKGKMQNDEELINKGGSFKKATKGFEPMKHKRSDKSEKRIGQIENSSIHNYSKGKEFRKEKESENIEMISKTDNSSFLGKENGTKNHERKNLKISDSNDKCEFVEGIDKITQTNNRFPFKEEEEHFETLDTITQTDDSILNCSEEVFLDTDVKKRNKKDKQLNKKRNTSEKLSLDQKNEQTKKFNDNQISTTKDEMKKLSEENSIDEISENTFYQNSTKNEKDISNSNFKENESSKFAINHNEDKELNFQFNNFQKNKNYYTNSSKSPTKVFQNMESLEKSSLSSLKTDIKDGRKKPNYTVLLNHETQKSTKDNFNTNNFEKKSTKNYSNGDKNFNHNESLKIKSPNSRAKEKSLEDSKQSNHLDFYDSNFHHKHKIKTKRRYSKLFFKDPKYYQINLEPFQRKNQSTSTNNMNKDNFMSTEQSTDKCTLTTNNSNYFSQVKKFLELKMHKKHQNEKTQIIKNKKLRDIIQKEIHKTVKESAIKEHNNLGKYQISNEKDKNSNDKKLINPSVLSKESNKPNKKKHQTTRKYLTKQGKGKKFNEKTNQERKTSDKSKRFPIRASSEKKNYQNDNFFEDFNSGNDLIRDDMSDSSDSFSPIITHFFSKSEKMILAPQNNEKIEENSLKDMNEITNYISSQ